MPRALRELSSTDILPPGTYEEVRNAERARIMALKTWRRVEVGPHATFYFENYDTMWLQVHEMLRIEKGGAAQIEDELSAYNPLIPKGRELVATLMFEIDDPVARDTLLRALTFVETTVFMEVGTERIAALAETDVERTKADGKTSSVHFLHFPFTDAQVRAFRDPAQRVLLGIGHARYQHMAVLTPETRQALAQDFA
jgi:hypothetical protein